MSYKRTYYVYIITNKYNSVFYIGITNNLSKRITDHQNGFVKGFSKTYNVNKLVYFEIYDDIRYAIDREKKLKKWKREWKLNLIKKDNREFKDLMVDIVL